MTQENRETMQRAIGTIEGAYCCASPKVQDALQCAVEMLEAVLESEVKNEHSKRDF